jgi:hypothetical protein
VNCAATVHAPLLFGENSLYAIEKYSTCALCH